VFPVKDRKALLDDEVTAVIRKAAIKIAERLAIEMETIGVDKNLRYLFSSAHPKMALGRIVQMCKSLTAREIFRGKLAVKRVLWGGEFWTDGSSVATVGERANCQPVERDVQRQGHPSEDLRQLRMS
jgi:putative transposase